MSFYSIFYDLWSIILADTTFIGLFTELTLILVVIGSFWLFWNSVTLFRYKTNKTFFYVTVAIIILWVFKFLYPDGLLYIAP